MTNKPKADEFGWPRKNGFVQPLVDRHCSTAWTASQGHGALRPHGRGRHGNGRRRHRHRRIRRRTATPRSNGSKRQVPGGLRRRKVPDPQKARHNLRGPVPIDPLARGGRRQRSPGHPERLPRRGPEAPLRVHRPGRTRSDAGSSCSSTRNRRAGHGQEVHLRTAQGPRPRPGRPGSDPRTRLHPPWRGLPVRSARAARLLPATPHT